MPLPPSATDHVDAFAEAYAPLSPPQRGLTALFALYYALFRAVWESRVRNAHFSPQLGENGKQIEVVAFETETLDKILCAFRHAALALAHDVPWDDNLKAAVAILDELGEAPIVPAEMRN